MPTISKNKVNGVVYDLMDEQARQNIADLKDAISSEIELPWAGTEANPLGWRTGYYTGSVGDTYTRSAVNYYLCAVLSLRTSNYPALKDAIFIKITPPEGYAVQIKQVDDANVIERIWGQINTETHPEDAGVSVMFPFDKTKKYIVSLGRFNDNDSGDYITQEFIGSIKLTANTMSLNSKMTRPSDGYVWFDVNVPRPLPFGDQVRSSQTTIETVEAVMRLPTNYTPDGTPTRLVMCCHGSGGYIKASAQIWYNVSITAWTDLMDSLLAAGYAVFDANIFPTDTGAGVMGYALGSPLHVQTLKAAYDYIVQNYNVYPEIFAHGTSMGGVSATAFSHCYPQLVLAESSFAGRDILRYMKTVPTSAEDGDAVPYGYESIAALNADKFSHIEGTYPSLSLFKVEDGSVVMPPDREADYQGWLAYYTAVDNLGRNDDAGDWIGQRSVPYCAWNSWADNESHTKLQEVLKKAYNRGGSCPYYVINYETGSHSDMSFGLVNNMKDQLIAWLKRWE